MLNSKELTLKLMSSNSTKNNKIINPESGSVIFAEVPENKTGIPSGFINLKLGFIGTGRDRRGAFGARHIWEKHKLDLNIQSPDLLPQIIKDILQPGVDILYESKDKPVVLNTVKGLVSLQLKKDALGNNEYSIISAYGRKNSRGVVFAQLKKA